VGFVELSKKQLREIHLLECSPCIEYGIGYLNRKALSEASLAFIRMMERTENE
jgi:hypothetical protein